MSKKHQKDLALLKAAFQSASLALSTCHNLTVTDRSDLPRDEWPIYVLNHKRELALIDEALRHLNDYNGL